VPRRCENRYKQGLISDWGIKKFNLDDLYVRFFRLAERCISENTGKGVVCYISNYSWVSKSSFVILRQNLLKNFNKFWIENMHGNRNNSEYAPDGRTSETIFSIPGFSAGIKQEVVISLWLKDNSQQGTKVLFRDDIDAAKAVERRSQLLDSLNNQDFDDFYQVSNPEKSNRYSFRPSDVSSHYLAWPKLTDLCADSPITGYKENRGYSFIDTDKTILTERISQYFDKNVSWEDLERLNTGLTKDVARFDAKKARDKILKLQEKFNQKMLLRYLLRPYEVKWCYYTQIRPLWNESRPSLFIHQFQGNSFLVSRPAGVATPEGIPFYFTNCLGDFDFIRGHAYHFPMRLRQNYSETVNTEDNTQGKLFDSSDFNTSQIKANLSEKSRQYLKQIGINNLEENIENASLIWLHALAIGYSPLYLQENADGIRQDFPRIPLPNSQELLIKSAELGQAIASLLDTENPVIGVTKKPTPALQKIALISCTDGVNLNPDKGDLIINVGWGHGGKNGVTMPGKGKAIARQYTTAEMSVISPEMRKLLGTKTYDIYLNDRAYWQNIPSRVWEYTIGGYQVIKKWLSYREEKLLGRGLTIAEVQEVSEMTRRITAIILLESDLDDNYQNIKTAVYSF
jgi:predicted helicase